MKKIAKQPTKKQTKLKVGVPDKGIPASKRPKPFPVVGFGASAGGMEAFQSVLSHLDANLGMAYVLVMHLSPHHKSALTKILQAKTTMAVQTVKNGMEVMANTVYVIPPNTFMSIVDGHLKLAPRSLSTIGNFAIDYFLTTLASVYKNNAIGVILSGAASDGTLGLKAIKEHGGITFAQDDSAKFDGMPGTALESGHVDFVLSPEGIASELARLIQVPYTILPHKKIETRQAKEIVDHAIEIRKILSLVKVKTGIDFYHHYKPASIYRRIVRRMVLNKFDQLTDYYDMMQRNPAEVDALYGDFLINVTNFFRDPEFFTVLVKRIFPALLVKGSEQEVIRIWVAGCSTGEEAYSIAICLQEYLDAKGSLRRFQLFASDLDATAIEKARLGIYPVSALQGVSADQCKRHFVKVGELFQIIAKLRQTCVFSHHNVLKDPPFSRMDLISCQNLLIYLQTRSQERAIQTFHYALKPNGYLFLGKSETVGAMTDLFKSLDKTIRLFAPVPAVPSKLEFAIHPVDGVEQSRESSGSVVTRDIRDLILSRFAYPCVVLDDQMKIVEFFGDTSFYLSPTIGKASLNILKMIREDLIAHVGSLIQNVRQTQKAATKEGIIIQTKSVTSEVKIEVLPRKLGGENFMLVVFRRNLILSAAVLKRSNGNGTSSANRIARLENDLVESRGLVKSTNEKYEITYEELQANTEEISSSNEELQTINEELESSKEELQSANEELVNTNEELAKRNLDLNVSYAELKKVNGQLEQFAFISSHDLQEPLRKIQSFASLLTTKEANLNAFSLRYSSKINEAAQRMSRLLNDLLGFSLLGNDGKSKQQVDLNTIVKNVLGDYEAVIGKRHVKVKVSHLPTIHAEPVQINQLFHNLVGNAIKFSRSKPIISISARKVTAKDYATHAALIQGVSYAVITVTDNGIGFDSVYAERIFILFQKLNDKKGVTGTGIGLAICKKIVEDHGGLIVATGKENAGATFTIFLPSGVGT